MSLTYTSDPQPIDRVDAHEPFTPVYARTGKSRARSGKGGFKTWMVLAPIGVLGLGALGVLAMSGGESAEPTVAPTAVETGFPAPSPLIAEPVAEAPLTSAATPAPVIAEPVATAPAPVARRAQPAARPAPAPRAAPVETAAPALTVEAAPEPTGPRPYVAEPAAAAAAAPLIVLPVAD